ncbi:MAG: alpha/beta fold hydrolase [Proteobacteria bacterium]|nr:alpha/beta fold hydrolase [Pseudomonadota bacterium]
MVANADILRQYYPFQSRFTQVYKQRMHYLDEGQGEVLLALHGNPTWSFFYRNIVKQLRGQYRLVVPDHIGCGFSAKPSTKHYSYQLEQRVLDLENLVKQLNLKDITLVLHDWGGMIGLAFAARNPQLVKRFVLMNTSGFALPKTKRFPIALTLSRTPFLGAFLNRGCNVFAVSASWIGKKRERMPKILRKLYRLPYNSWHNRLAIHQFVQDIPLKPQHPSWALVDEVSRHLETLGQKPLLILWGERDFIFDRNFLAEWRRRLPHAEYHSYPDAGHYILEDLGDEAVSLLQDFLLRHPLQTP